MQEEMTEKPLPAAPAAELAAGGRGGRSGLSLRRIVRGEQSEFDRLYRHHHQEIYRYCLAILRNPEDAEDALQSTMTAALRSLPGEEREIELRPWLFRVAHNEAITLARRRRPTAELTDENDPVTGSAEIAHGERERLRQLVADLQTLPDRQCSALVMRELSGLSYGEIGEALSCAEGAARQTVHEARVALTHIAEGREMECEGIQQLISERDRRRLRGRRIRAHLQGCDACTAYAAGIERRQADLQALCPPISLVASTAVLGGILGGGGAAGTAASVSAGGLAGGGLIGGGGLAGGGLAGSVALKGASIAAAGALAVGAADVSGVVNVPGLGGSNGDAPSRSTPGSEGGAPEGGAAGGGTAPGYEGSSGGSEDLPGKSEDAPGQDGSPGKSENASGQQGSPGKSEDAPGQDGSPGKSETAPGQDGSPGKSEDAPGQQGSQGNSGNAPGHDGTPGNSGTAPGQSGSQGNSGSAPGQQASPGNSGTAPGQSGSPGNSGSAGGSGSPAVPIPGGPSVPPGQGANPPGLGLGGIVPGHGSKNP
jgi:RNA polymerase sigma factor (sigma-70 family)